MGRRTKTSTPKRTTNTKLNLARSLASKHFSLRSLAKAVRLNEKTLRKYGVKASGSQTGPDAAGTELDLDESAAAAYDDDGYDPFGYDEDGHDSDGFDAFYKHRNGTLYDNDGFDSGGFDVFYKHRNGTLCDDDGFNHGGFNKDGIHRWTGSLYDGDGHDSGGFDVFDKHRNGTRYDDDGSDVNGCDVFGEDRFERS